MGIDFMPGLVAMLGGFVVLFLLVLFDHITDKFFYPKQRYDDNALRQRYDDTTLRQKSREIDAEFRRNVAKAKYRLNNEEFAGVNGQTMLTFCAGSYYPFIVPKPLKKQ